MSEILKALVEPIAGLLLKSTLGDTASKIGTGLIKIGIDKALSQDARSKAMAAAGIVVTDLQEALGHDRFPDADLASAALSLSETLNDHLSAAFLINRKLKTDDIASGLRNARSPERIYPNNDPAIDAYRRLIDELAPRLRALGPAFKDYNVERDSHILETLERLSTRQQKLAEGFERHYLGSVIAQHDYVDIVGIDLDSKSRKSLLSVAYFSLRAQLADRDSQPKLDFSTILTLLPLLGNRLLIEGMAGSGKSTLTRWAAIEMGKWRLHHRRDEPPEISAQAINWAQYLLPQAPRRSPKAEDDDKFVAVMAEAGVPFEFKEKRIVVETSDLDLSLRTRDGLDALASAATRMSAEIWLKRIPLLIPLRRVKGQLELSAFPKLSAPQMPSMPEGWLQDTMSDGGRHVLLIFDGLDEVPAGGRRNDMLHQILAIGRQYTAAQIIVTTRPNATADDALPGYRKIILQDLDEPLQVKQFMAHWHEALAVTAGRARNDAVSADLARAAGREIEAQAALASLARNPLLLAAVCAVHWQKRREKVEECWRNSTDERPTFDGFVMPENIWNLVEQLTRMLVDQRDRDREISIDDQEPEYKLSYEIKRECLSRIAFQMTSDEFSSALDESETINQIKAVIADSANIQNLSAGKILQALLERSGVLRGSGEKEVEFVHNTIKAFLAAKFYLSLRAPQMLLRRIEASSPEEISAGLDEVSLFAAASPDHADYAEHLVKGFIEERWLSRVLKARAKKEQKRLLQLLAVRCEARAVLLPQKLRSTIRSLSVRLLPPRNQHEARQLATLGEAIIPRLAPRADMNAEYELSSVQCLKMIATKKSVYMIQKYSNTKNLTTAEKIVDYIHPLKIDAVLMEIQSSTRNNLSPTLAKAISDIEPIKALTSLQWLSLDQTGVHEDDPVPQALRARGVNVLI